MSLSIQRRSGDTVYECGFLTIPFRPDARIGGNPSENDVAYLKELNVLATSNQRASKFQLIIQMVVTPKMKRLEVSRRAHSHT